jgi:hypothetical protein
VESQHDSCVLIIGDRAIVRADAGPLDAEFALFGADCIELKTTEPGAVREAGYRTTCAEALERLAEIGVTPEIAEATARAMRPHVAACYARGAVVRRAVHELSASELFEGKVYLASARVYEGQWLDLAALTFDLGDPNLARVLQAMHLASVLAEVPDDMDVYLSTLALTQNQRPGVRTFKRVSFGEPGRWPELVAAYAENRPPGSVREGGPTRVEVLDWLQVLGQSDGGRERAARIERAIASTPRPQPDRGPLSDPVAWAIESQLDSGDANAALARIDMMERDRGSNPCVVYLRSRASLLLKSEDPRVIAERVSMLAANASFDELELLAAQAWAAAGNMGRALPYARVLASNPRAPSELRTRARRLVDLVESARPPQRVSAMPARGPSGKRTTGRVVSESPADPAPEVSGVMRRDSPLPAVLAASGMSTPSEAPRREPPREAKRDERQIATLPPPSSPSPLPELDDPATPHPEAHARTDERTFNKGISRPAFRAVTTNSTPPRLALGKLELAENFSDPPPPASKADTRVRAAFDARVQCTEMARELGMLYRTQHGIELRNDIGSLEAVQAELMSRYHETGVRTVSAMLDLRRHGAFVSEVIARSLRATWLDVAPTELGHWTMFVPPDTRVWPFARVLRFVTMGSKERDLVAYFLELHARSC